MPFTIVLPDDSHFAIADIPDVIEFVSTEAVLGTRFSSTQFTGSGSYRGDAATYSAFGNGFSTAVTVDGLIYVATGVIDTILVTTVIDSMTITGVDIDMLTFAPIRLLDLSGVDPIAIETYIMSRAWDITLGKLDDVLPEGSTIGDGATFNTLGDDIFRGGRGNDDLFSGDGRDILFGNRGDDRLSGGMGRDILKGGQDDDVLEGGIGRDRLFGQIGNDRLDSGKGDDVLHGGAGNDVFVFANKYGNDTVFDFDATNDDELIDLTAVTRIRSFDDLMNNHISQVGTSVVIDDSDRTIITLHNVDLADLDAADFLF
ncbi:calcium-binding protein [Sedimentitalea sp. XS_ASV28]|uniref:calcium-binding protein n=1 Tax=Sedimentitalea sp. XS_ASV28 TaxID=3241296 RepID=UPI0035120CD6